MNNDISLFQNEDPINWSPEKKKAIYRFLQNEEMQEIRDIVMRNAERMENKVVELTNDITEIKSVVGNFAEKEYFVKRTHGLEYNSLESIGREFNPTLNRKQMPILLKKLGIMQKFNNEPMAIYQSGNNPMAIKKKHFDDYGVERFSYHYNSDKLWDKITSILQQRKILDVLLSCKNKDQVWNFINSL